jgi:hypothetical protein
MRYQSFLFWSPIHGCHAERLSMWDRQGGEFFAIVPMNGTSKQNKHDRQQALEAIADAIEGGAQPGAVTVCF